MVSKPISPRARLVTAQMCKTAPGANIDYLDRHVLECLGASLSGIAGAGWTEKAHREDVAKVSTWLKDLRSRNPPDSVFCRMLGADGQSRWYEVRGELLGATDDEGRGRYDVLIDTDGRRESEVTTRESEHRVLQIGQLQGLIFAPLLRIRTTLDLERVECAEQVLPESEGMFHDYAESASDWFWEIGADYKFKMLTKNAFGSNATDRIGRVCWDCALDLETEPEKWRLVRATLESREPFRDFVYCSTGGGGAPMYVKASGWPVFDASGEFRGYRGAGTDVTATIRAEEEHERLRQLESDLVHMNRLNVMGELAASLAHEITQPIGSARNNVRAALNFLDNDPPDLNEVKEALSCAVDDADRAGKIIDRIRSHIKKAPPQKERFDLNEAINEGIILARNAIAENRVVVETALSEGLLPVEGDRVQLQQVVLNLILNAVEAMDSVQGGPRELAISTEQNQAWGALVTIRDSGPGVDPANLGRIFHAFYTTKSSGVGIGLAICRSIVDAHGGRLWVDANEPQGAVFQFTLPRAGETYDSSPNAKAL
jgi:signal transduction histidine kinase